MINYPDWDKAPEGATHFHFGSMRYSPHWYKQGYFCVTDCEGEGWKKDSYPTHISEYLERPKTKPKPKQWSGPQDGLPPVGMTVELWRDGVNGQHVEIVGHFQAANKVAAYVPIDGQRIVSQAIAGCFQPINSQQQKRETAIREIMGAAGIDCRVTAARLVDAGFKREVV